MDAPRTLEALVERYDGKIRAFLKTVTSIGQEDLDDMVQDVYLRVHKYGLLDRYTKDRSAFTSYLYLVCQSVARNKHRAASRRLHPLQLDRAYSRVDSGGPWQNKYRLDARTAKAATQADDLYIRELREFLLAKPELLPVIERVDRTGRITKKDHAALLGALQPVLA